MYTTKARGQIAQTWETSRQSYKMSYCLLVSLGSPYFSLGLHMTVPKTSGPFWGGNRAKSRNINVFLLILAQGAALYKHKLTYIGVPSLNWF